MIEHFEKYRHLLGGMLFGLAYMPMLVKFAPHIDSFFNTKNSDSAYVLDLSMDDVNSAIFKDRFSDYEPYFVTVADDFADSLGNVLYDEAQDEVKTVIESAVKEKDLNKKTQKSVVLAKKTARIAGYGAVNVVKGDIKSNFYVDARRLDIPVKVIDSMIRNLSSKINFRSSLKRGDKFEVVYSDKNEMIYGRIMTKRADAAVYKYPKGKGAGYYFANGEKAEQMTRGSNFGSPLAGRLVVSDPFGWRRHPITGRLHNHSGVDLRARYGTPVYAIHDGIVKRASFYSGYGRCVDIKHIGGYQSRYAHLSRFAVRFGSAVKKGQIIGYVGSSGVSTGPHLHLELAKNNKVMNPLSIKMIPSEKKYFPNMTNFKLFKKHVDKVVKKY